MRVQVEIGYGGKDDPRYIYVTGAEGLSVPAVGDVVSYHGQKTTTPRLVVRERRFRFEPFQPPDGVLYVALWCERVRAEGGEVSEEFVVASEIVTGNEPGAVERKFYLSDEAVARYLYGWSEPMRLHIRLLRQEDGRPAYELVAALVRENA